MLDNDSIQFIFKNSLKLLIAVFSLILFILLLLFLADANFNDLSKPFLKVLLVVEKMLIYFQLF